MCELVAEGKILVLAGHWQDEPQYLTTEVAIPILQDPHRYTLEVEDEGLPRVYYVNVDNIVD